MPSLVTLTRLVIYIEIFAIASVTVFLYRYVEHDATYLPELPINNPGYKIGQPVLSWRTSETYYKLRNNGVKILLQRLIIPTYLLEYNIISHRLGYKIRLADDTLFQCNQTAHGSPDFWCNTYRSRMHYRISNYEGADITFTDYIPGLYEHVIFKANLVSRGGKYIPKGFHIPIQIKEFLQYSLLPENKDKRWIQKSSVHRENKVKEFYDLDLDQDSIIQEFIGNPFLIDGRKFSIGVYVAFSSAKPLRAYEMYSDVLLRFCSEAYNPDNFTEFRSYVTDGMEFGIEFIRQICSLKNLNVKHQYSAKKCIDTYVNAAGGDSSTINLQIRDAIRDVLTTRKDLIEDNVDSRSRYFKWTRWDFILDSDLKIYLVEANLNPSMSCEEEDIDQRQDRASCHNAVYNLFRATGIASFYDFHKTSIHYVVRDSDINIENGICYSPACNLCKLKECQLCSKCLSVNDRDNLKSVLWEHLRRGQTRLVYPFITDKPNDDSSTVGTDDNALIQEWLKLKCLRDIQWCNDIT